MSPTAKACRVYRPARRTCAGSVSICPACSRRIDRKRIDAIAHAKRMEPRVGPTRKGPKKIGRNVCAGTMGWTPPHPDWRTAHDCRRVRPVNEEEPETDIIRVGIDLAENVFQMRGVDRSEKAVWRRKLTRVEWLDVLQRTAPLHAVWVYVIGVLKAVLNAAVEWKWIDRAPKTKKTKVVSHRLRGTPWQVLEELGGWETLEMVQRYAHLSADHLAQWVQPMMAPAGPQLAAIRGVGTTEHSLKALRLLVRPAGIEKPEESRAR